MKDLCVVYLARGLNGIKPFKYFLESYQVNPSGVEHDLLIIFKGFDHQKNTEEYLPLLTSVKHLTLEISDEGFDITAYFAAVDLYSEQYRYFCFLNSFSIIQNSEWLKKLHQNISKPGVSLVGATGSWNSNSRNARTWFKNVATKEIRHKIYPRNWTKTENRPQSRNLIHIIIAYKKAIISFIKLARNNILHIINFGGFPNYHVRTNAFMISGEMMKAVNCPTLITKLDAYKFESGRKSLTMQILKKGKNVLIVGKDGIGYEKENWHKSKIFWLSNQENLLVADNQTRDYQQGAPERRDYLSFIGWEIQ